MISPLLIQHFTPMRPNVVHGLVEAVVDVRAHRVQRDATVGVGLGAGHLRATEATGDLDLAALGAGAHRAGERALHRAPEGDAVAQLLGDRLGDEVRVELRDA